MGGYIARRELRIGAKTYERGEPLSAMAFEALPKRTRKALERLGWVEARANGPEPKEETRRKESARKAGEA